MFHERAYAKVNLVLHVGRRREDGMHPVCSLFASLDLADDVQGDPIDGGADRIDCPGVEGPNLAQAALAAFRARVGQALPPLGLRIEKRIPVAAGLGGGSADAAAVLRLANRVAGDPLDTAELHALAAVLGSDVPSQLEPRHALVQGTGELVEPIDLPRLAALLVPAREGLSTRAVYAELDRMDGGRERLAPDTLRLLAGAAPRELASALENDLQPAALALRPELADILASIRAAGALGVAVSGSGPTCFGLFDDSAAAEWAAASVPGALVSGLRGG
ncbi:MAG TPA: 4-(cytidine 5'-diphospho)-2-C-methyl-D-erythritol kinase [Thermoleophilaceae bacterium]